MQHAGDAAPLEERRIGLFPWRTASRPNVGRCPGSPRTSTRTKQLINYVCPNTLRPTLSGIGHSFYACFDQPLFQLASVNDFDSEEELKSRRPPKRPAPSFSHDRSAPAEPLRNPSGDKADNGSRCGGRIGRQFPGSLSRPATALVVGLTS